MSRSRVVLFAITAVALAAPAVALLAQVRYAGFLAGSLLLVYLGLAMGAVHLSFHDGWPVRIRKGVAVALTVAGLTGVVNWALTPPQHLPWEKDEATAFERARAEDKGVMIDFAADWCTPCAELEHTFADEDVYAGIVDNFIPLKFDVTEGTAADEERQERYSAQTLPAVVFLDAEGNELGRVDKYLPPADFNKVLEPAVHRLRTGDTDGAVLTDDWGLYAKRGWFWMYLAAFGFGFLTSLTPCVYPMIPIVVGVFGARDTTVTRRKGFVLASFYVLGMGLTYSVLGVIFALLGKQFGAILGNPYVVLPLVGFYVALATSMFGAFEFNLPTSWQQRLSQVGGSGYGGALGMGLVGGLTAAPCTGPFLAGILGFVAASRNVPAGFTLLFTYALGMGILFWVIGAFAVSLPRSGRWMEWAKSIGGIALLAVGIFFLRGIFPILKSFP